MTILKRTLLSALACASLALSAQLVEKASPDTKAKSKVVKAAAARAAPEKKTFTKGLDAFGITPRALAAWKRSGAREELGFKVVTFQRRASNDQGRPVFEMHGKDAFDKSDHTPTLALLRLAPAGPEMSLNSGTSWIQGEEAQKTWRFAFDNQFVTLSAMDEVFKPTAFKALAFERGAVVRRKEVFQSVINPFFHSVVVVLAYGKNEVQGILKYPGTTFVVPFQGVRHKERWIARSLAYAPFNVGVTTRPSGGGTGVGATNLITEDSKITQIELDDRRVLLGTGAFLNYALETETFERLETASEFEMAVAKDLPALSEAFHANFSRSLWTKSDEEGSFSREAEKTFFQAGLKAWFWAPWQTRGHDDPMYASNNTKRGRESLDPMMRRIQAIGGEFRLLDPSGAPPSSNQPTLSPRRSGNPQEDPYSAGVNPSKFPLGAVTAGGRLVSIHSPNEVRFWSADLKTATSVRTPMIEEMLTAVAISPDGHSLATSGFLGVRMWDAAAAKPSGILPMDGCQEYHCPVFSPDGTLVAAGGKDGRTRIWDVRTGRLLGSTVDGGWSVRLVRRDEPVTTRHRGNMVSALAFSADGHLLAEGHAGGELKIWDITDRSKPKKIKSVDMDLGLIWRLKFLHEGRELAVLNAKGSFRVLDAMDWKVSRKGDNTLPTTTSALFEPSGETVVTSHAGGKVVRVNLGTGTIEKDVTMDGVSFGVLAERDGMAFLLGDSWKPVGF